MNGPCTCNTPCVLIQLHPADGTAVAVHNCACNRTKQRIDPVGEKLLLRLNPDGTECEQGDHPAYIISIINAGRNLRGWKGASA